MSNTSFTFHHVQDGSVRALLTDSPRGDWFALCLDENFLFFDIKGDELPLDVWQKFSRTVEDAIISEIKKGIHEEASVEEGVTEW